MNCAPSHEDKVWTHALPHEEVADPMWDWHAQKKIFSTSCPVAAVDVTRLDKCSGL